MNPQGTHKKFSPRDAVFFALLIIICVAGSVAVLWFAVGVESGNQIIKDFMRALLDNAVGIVLALILFNILLVMFYSKKRS